MRILVPTDFSRLSRVALEYAVKIARKPNAELILLHIVQPKALPRRAVVTVSTKRDAMVAKAKEECARLVNEIASDARVRLSISYKVRKGHSAADIISNFAHRNDISLVVLGTKGATGLKKILMGSTASAVVNKCHVPVITVPEFARFKSLKHIVYASDLAHTKAEMTVLVPFARIFDATLHLLHIRTSATKEKADRRGMLADLKAKMKYPRITFHVSADDDIENGIEEYCARKKADMLVMFTRDLTFFGKLFGRSVTRKMVFQGWIPLLSLKKGSELA